MNHQYEVETIGANIDDIGVRSIKKGSATYLCMGDTFAPHTSDVFNIAVWTMLKFKDHYIRYEESGDKHIGRVVAGLPVFSKNSAWFTPYFYIKNTDRDERDGDGGYKTYEPGQESDINTFTLEYFNGFISMLLPFADPFQFNPVLKYSAACLLYARVFFDSTLPIQRYVFTQTLYYYALLHYSTYITDQKYTTAKY